MKLLYVEDDTVDQMAFSRLSRGVSDLHFDLATSIDEAFALIESNQYDLILSDFYLGRDTAMDLFDRILHIPVILLSGGDEIRPMQGKGFPNYIGSLVKPLKLEELQAIMNGTLQKMPPKSTPPINRRPNLLEFDFTYLERLGGATDTFKMEMLEIFCQLGTEELPQIEQSLQSKNYQSIQRLVHKLKSNLRILGLQRLLETAESIEKASEKVNDTEAYHSKLRIWLQHMYLAIQKARLEASRLSEA